jgi:hypothetical protein
MKECFIPRDFRKATLKLINQANAIIEKFQLLGFILTVRQLYYQMVKANLIVNTKKTYDKVKETINNAKLAGLVDWAAIEDRRRTLEGRSHWDSPFDAMQSIADQYARDRWEGQKYRPEFFVEKEALEGIVERVALANDVSYLACCGYNSGTVLYNCAQRIRERRKRGQETVIIYAGDHDPSGLDMSDGDMPGRLETFLKKYSHGPVEIRRIALNLDQVSLYKPPPNFAKETDTRYGAYKKKYGEKCWEVDALEPDVLMALYQAEVDRMKDAALYDKMTELEASEQQTLSRIADRFDDVARFLESD